MLSWIERKDINRHAYALYVPHHDTVILSPRADRAMPAHEFAHALGVRHGTDEPNIAWRIERGVRRGEICPTT